VPSGWGEEHRSLDGNVLEEVLHVHAEFREARARERFVEAGEGGRRVRTLLIERIYLHEATLRNDPVLRDTETLVQRAFLPSIACFGRGRKDLDDAVRPR
jgi:hypothetical protein